MSATADGPGLPRPLRLVQRLIWIYAAAAVAVVVVPMVGRIAGARLPRLNALAEEIAASGLDGSVLSALLLALTALTAVGLLAVARAGPGNGEAATTVRGRWLAWLNEPGPAARQGQALLVPVGAVMIWTVIGLLWPVAGHAERQPALGNLAAAFVVGLAFASLVAERVVNAFPDAQLPEAPALHRLLLLVTVVLAVAAGVQFGDSAGVSWMVWPERVIVCVPGAVAAELALRALARLFLPAPQPARARAVTDSILVGLLTGGSRAPGALLRTQLGLDFARSWALTFVARAAAPALLLTGLLCWGLSGLQLIQYDHRGVYERFGAPVAVLGPGLHLLLPWPLGKVRPVEYGVIHSVPVGVRGDASVGVGGMSPPIGAEATPPRNYNRLWASVHPDQAQYLVPSAGTGQLGFQSVDTEIFVLYKVGPTDRDALESLFAVRQPKELVRDVANRVVLNYFDTHTLDDVLGAPIEDVARHLRRELAADIGRYDAGIDIVSVLVEEIHPPIGAAAAYHAVQAAEIDSNASVSDAVARAHRVAGVAREEGHQLVTAADAQAVETQGQAAATAYRFGAERRAFAAGGRAFLLERYVSDLTRALGGRPLTILDGRLDSSAGPIIDMRATPAGTAAAALAVAGSP